MSWDLHQINLEDAELDLYVALTALGEYARKTGNDATIIIDKKVTVGPWTR